MKWTKKGHELDQLMEELRQMRRLYIFGISYIAQEILNVIAKLKDGFPCALVLIDSDGEKQRQGISGWEIHSPQYLYDRLTASDRVVVAPFDRAGEEIRGLCLAHGVQPEQIFDGVSFLCRILPIYLSQAYQKVVFHSAGMLPTTVCNLNCRDCLNFTPYLRQHITYSLSECKENVDLFFQAVGLVFRFQITGGEPFLYRELCPLLDYIGGRYRGQILRFELVTNATVLPSDEIIAALERNKVTVYLDDYTMSLPARQAALHDEVMMRLRNGGVRVIDNHVDQWFRLYTPEQLPAERGSREMEAMFRKCAVPYTTLENGRICSCNYGLYAAKAGVMEDCDAEYFDLRSYTPDKARELLEFRCGYNERGYVNLCRVCNGWGGNHTYCQPALQQQRADVDGQEER